MPFITGGRVTALVSEAADGATLPSKFVGIGASDGSLLQALLVESAANPNLRIALFNGANAMGGTFGASDGQAASNAALRSSTAIFEFNGTTWDRVRHSFEQASTGLTSVGVGTTVDISTTPMSKAVLSILRTVGSSAYIVDLQASIEGTFWTTIATLSKNSNNVEVDYAVDKPFTAFRYNITTIGSGNTLSINILASAR